MGNRELSAAERHLAALEAAPDAVIGINEHGVVFFWNRTAQTLFSIEQNLACGQDLNDLLRPNWPADSWKQTFSTLHWGDSARAAHWHDIELSTPAGPRADLQISLGHGGRAGQGELFVYLRERPRLTMLQLMKSRGHDLRTPMNAIVGMLDLLAESARDDIQRDYIKTAQQSGASLMELFNAASTPAEMHANTRLPSLRVVYVAEGEEAQSWGHDLANLGVLPTQCKSGSDVLTSLQKARAEGDPYRIALLPENMIDLDGETLGAAIKSDSAYADTLLVLYGSEHLASAQSLAEEGFSAYLQRPVSLEVLTLTLERLSQAICQNEAPAFIVADNINQSWADGVAAGRVPRVLVVEDHVVNQVVVTRMLESMGCEVAIADDGQRALEYYRHHEFDVILMDCQMPVMDGYQATKAIRALEKERNDGRHAPIVALTAQALPGEKERCLASGMDDFLSKPIRLDTLRNAIRHWMGHAALHGLGVKEQGAHAEDSLDEMREMFGDDFNELAALFQNDSPKRIQTMYDSLAKADAAELTRVAHALSGSAASMGAGGLSNLCKALEAKCKTGILDDVEQRLERVQAEYSRIDARIREMLAGS